jgi:alpha-mannosidase
VRGRVVEAWLPLECEAGAPGIEIEDADGNAVEIIDKEEVKRIADRMLRVRFIAPELPPFGYASFHYRFAPKAAPAPGIGPVARQAVLENGRYRIELDPSGVVSARDKSLGEEILTRGAGGLILEEDYGSPWETLARPYNRADLREQSEIRVSVLRGAGRQCAVIEGKFRPAFVERGKLHVERLEWRQEIAIYDGAEGIHVRTEIDWDSENCRVMLQFPLPFRTPNDEAFYEVPFGVLKRAAYDGQYGEHTLPNGDWPALNYVSCRNSEKNYSVNLLNKGIPCHQVRNGVVFATPLRSPQVPVYAFDFEGARDAGRHVFEHVVTAHRGGVAGGSVARTGAELNAAFLSLPARAKEAALPARHAFLAGKSDSIVYSALKRAEDNDGLVARAYEPYGRKTDERFANLDSRSIEETDPLEESARPVKSLEFRPFEIRTFRIR